MSRIKCRFPGWGGESTSSQVVQPPPGPPIHYYDDYEIGVGAGNLCQLQLALERR